jgi:hypothetical protein
VSDGSHGNAQYKRGRPYAKSTQHAEHVAEFGGRIGRTSGQLASKLPLEQPSSVE